VGDCNRQFHGRGSFLVGVVVVWSDGRNFGFSEAYCRTNPRSLSRIELCFYVRRNLAFGANGQLEGGGAP
jgi:hypothetical protein